MPTIYKCPGCGAAMEFDSTTQKLGCPSCVGLPQNEQYSQNSTQGEYDKEMKMYTHLLQALHHMYYNGTSSSLCHILPVYCSVNISLHIPEHQSAFHMTDSLISVWCCYGV